jgi:hypothetical protein
VILEQRQEVIEFGLMPIFVGVSVQDAQRTPYLKYVPAVVQLQD